MLENGTYREPATNPARPWQAVPHRIGPNTNFGSTEEAHIGTYALAEIVDEGAHIAGYALPERCYLWSITNESIIVSNNATWSSDRSVSKPME